MLGQQVSSLLMEDSQNTYREKMEGMATNDGGRSWTAEMTLLTLVNKPLACRVTGFALDNVREGLMTVMTIQDISRINERKVMSEREKQKSESLLYEILPRKNCRHDE
jgi:hypothetical protein